MNIQLSPEAQAYFNEVAYSLDNGDGKVATQSQVINHCLLELAAFKKRYDTSVTDFLHEDSAKGFKRGLAASILEEAQEVSSTPEKAREYLQSQGEDPDAIVKEGLSMIRELQPKKVQSDAPALMTHKELVNIAYRWVLKNASCGVALKEFYTAACNGEYPDVIGFGSWGHSVLIEVKVSRADFLKDKSKSFRANPQLGMGTQRFYCCPTGLIKKEELPDGWGLIYVDEKSKCKVHYSPYTGNIQERHGGFDKNFRAEHGMMYSALRRLFIKGHLDCIYDKDYQRPSINELLNSKTENEPPTTNTTA